MKGETVNYCFFPKFYEWDDSPYYVFIGPNNKARVRVLSGPLKGQIGTVTHIEDMDGKLVQITMQDGRRVWLSALNCGLVH